MVGTRQPSPAHGVGWIAAFRERVRRRPGGWMAWRVAVAVAGVAVIVLGLILVPLPGPGWLTVFAGLAILGTEFRWANRLLRWVRRLVGRWWAWVALRPRRMQTLIGLAGVVFLAALAYVGWLIAYR